MDSEQTVKSFIFSLNYSKNAVKSLRGKSQLHTAFVRIFHSGEPAWSLEPNGKAGFLRGVCCFWGCQQNKTIVIKVNVN